MTVLNMLMRITKYPLPRSGQLLQCFAVLMFVKIIPSEGATILPARHGPYSLCQRECTSETRRRARCRLVIADRAPNYLCLALMCSVVDPEPGNFRKKVPQILIFFYLLPVLTTFFVNDHKPDP